MVSLSNSDILMHFFSQSPGETQHIAWQTIEREAKKLRKGAICIALAGELGSGKTTFVQGVGKKLGIKQHITSPTFLLMKELVLPRSYHAIGKIYHFDWYRLKDKRHIKALGWEAILKDTGNLVLVEWADKFPKLFPKGTCWIFFQPEADQPLAEKYQQPNVRIINVI